jgi:hypothetical protein
MGLIFGTQRSWQQMGRNDKNASRTYRQFNKKSLELNNEKEVSINA